MFEKVRKRDGRVVDFNPLKIKSAIAKAGEATGNNLNDFYKGKTRKDG